jgi:putative membrane protein
MIASFIINAVAVFIATYFINGVYIDNPATVLLLAVVFGLINTFIKPIVKLITLPINVVTLGLFSFVTNALLVMLASFLVPGFQIDGFMSAFLFGLVLSIVTTILNIFRK